MGTAGQLPNHVPVTTAHDFVLFGPQECSADVVGGASSPFDEKPRKISGEGKPDGEPAGKSGRKAKDPVKQTRFPSPAKPRIAVMHGPLASTLYACAVGPPFARGAAAQ